MIIKNNVVRLAREAAGLTTADAAQLVYVTRRTFEMWEAGDRQIPPAKQELFFAKLKGLRPEPGQLVVVVSESQMPLDVVASDNFLSLQDTGDGYAIISSLAVNRVTGRPYVHRTRFRIMPDNHHVIEMTRGWRVNESDI